MKRMLQGPGSRCLVCAMTVGLVPLVLALSCDFADRSPAGPAVETTTYAAEQTHAGDGPPQNAPGGGEFFPLEIGNRWTYMGQTSITEEVYGTGVTQSSVTYLEDHVLSGTEVLSGREYVVETQDLRDLSHNYAVTRWVRYRQDRAGLYEADVALNQPPATAKETGVGVGADESWEPWAVLRGRVANVPDAEIRIALEKAWRQMSDKLAAIEEMRGLKSGRFRVADGPPGGVLSDELTRLKYPLHPGQEWAVREVPYFGSVVEGHEVLDLPPGKMSCLRILMKSAIFGPEDEVLVWYGRDGYLGLSSHVETEALGPGGQQIGRIVFEDKMFLETIDLVGPGRF